MNDASNGFVPWRRCFYQNVAFFKKIPAVVAWLLLSSVLVYDELASLLAAQFIRQLNKRNCGKPATRLQISLNVCAEFVNSWFRSSVVQHCVFG